MVKTTGGWWNSCSMHLYLQEETHEAGDKAMVKAELADRLEALTAGQEIVLYGMEDNDKINTSIAEEDVFAIAKGVCAEANIKARKAGIFLKYEAFMFEGHIVMDCSDKGGTNL